MNPVIIAGAAQKGGVGKSTFVWALASFLAEEHPVLAIDLDPQGTLTAALAPSDYHRTLADVFQERCTLAEAIIPATPAYSTNLFIAPASPQLMNLETATGLNPNRQFLVADSIQSLKTHFQFILLDTPAGQGLLSIAALVASTGVISPVACQPAAYDTMTAFEQTIIQVRKRLNPKLQWFVLPSLFDQRQVLDREVLEALRTRFSDSLLEPPIRRRVRLAEQMSAGRRCSSHDFELVTQSILERIQT